MTWSTSVAGREKPRPARPTKPFTLSALAEQTPKGEPTKCGKQRALRVEPVLQQECAGAVDTQGGSVCNRTSTGRSGYERVTQNSRGKSRVQAAPGAVCFVPRRGKEARTERKGKSNNRTSSVWPVLPGKILIVQCQRVNPRQKKKEKGPQFRRVRRQKQYYDALKRRKPETPAAPGKSIGYLRGKGGTLVCIRGARLGGCKNHTMKPICSLL